MTQGTPKKRQRFNDWRPTFLQALREYGVVSYAAEQANVSRSEVYRAKERNADFSAAWDEALEVATDALEKEARRRAESGVMRLKFHQGMPIMVPVLDDDGKPLMEPVFDDNGEPVLDKHGRQKEQMVLTPYIEHEYSDTLMIFLLKAHRPKKYRDNVDITSDGQQIQGITYITENRPNADD